MNLLRSQKQVATVKNLNVKKITANVSILENHVLKNANVVIVKITKILKNTKKKDKMDVPAKKTHVNKTIVNATKVEKGVDLIANV